MVIFLEAFLDKNIGDDLMVEMLVHRYPFATFFALGPGEFNRELPYSNWENLLIVDRSFWEVYLDRFDAYINIGGSVWQDYGDNLEWYRLRSETVKQFRIANKPRLMIGNNIGPISSQVGEDLFVSIINDLSGITLRDQASFDWVRSRLPGSACKLTGDVILSREIELADVVPNMYGFTIHRDIVNETKNEGFLRNLNVVIEGLVRRVSEAQIRLFAFDTGPIQNDAISVSALFKSLSPAAQGRTEICLYDGDINQFIRLFSQCRHVFTSHFHGVILALKMAKPFTPFSYLNKSVDFLNELNFTGEVIDYENFEELQDYVVDNMLADGSSLDAKRYQKLVEGSRSNFDFADSLIPQEAGSNKRIWIDLLQDQTVILGIKNENINLNQQLKLSRDEVTGTRQQLQLAQDEVIGTRQQLQLAQDEVIGTRQQLQAAQYEVMDIRQQLQLAQEEVISIRQQLQADKDEITSNSEKLQSIEKQLASKNLIINGLVTAGSLRQQEIVNQSILIASLNTEIASLKNSFSWRITAPLRKVKNILKRRN